TPTPTPSATPTPTPTPTVLPAGPVAPGVWAWDALLGGECLDPFDDPWAEEFTVVDCAAPHPAQLVYRGTLAATDDDPSDDPFPGTEALQGQMSLLCTAPGVVDLAAAGQYSDAQFQGTYPANEEEWDAGDRTYYCFVSRSSGEPLTGSLAVPQAPPAG
ncbi:large membrane associated protein, partial [Schumannella luteola]